MKKKKVLDKYWRCKTRFSQQSRPFHLFSFCISGAWRRGGRLGHHIEAERLYDHLVVCMTIP
ncbi:unnamed protein product [Ixodes pacificus]